MEVGQPKQLLKHGVPVVLVLGSLLAASLIALSGHGALGLNQDRQHAIAHDLVARVWRITPTANGLATIKFDPAPGADLAGSELQAGVAGAGQTAQLTLGLQLANGTGQ